jgi:hypothetical protein
MPNLVGKTLGNYRIIEQIGMGGMATVFKAYQPSMDRYVALKVISPYLSQDPNFAKRFQQEARVIAKLEHLHILPVYDYGEEDGYFYLVMRFVEGGTLKDRLTQGSLPLEDARRIVAQVGSALEYAHQLGIVHRDFKPSNILIDPHGDCYLADFGIAKMTDGALGLTGSAALGTPRYMAPEQSQSLQVDHRADVYAMGVVIYEMVTGQVPFDAETPFAVVMKHLSEPLPVPRSVKPDLPEGVERVILKALAKAAADRYQSMRDLVTAFDQAVKASPAKALTATVLPSAAAPIPTVIEEAEVETPVTSVPAWPWWVEAQPRWLLVAAGLALVVLVLAGLILSQVPGQVEISGGQVQVVLSMETTIPAAGGVATAPTATPTPKPAQVFAEPILSDIANRPPDYEDDFSDLNSGWPIGSTERDAWGYEGGEYFILSGTKNFLRASTSARAPWVSDFVLEMDARFASGESGEWTLVFRDTTETPEQTVSGHYGLNFWLDGQVILFKYVDGVHTALMGGVPIQGRYEPKHIQLIARGSRIAVYVDGEPLWMVYDESLSAGALVLRSQTDTETPLRVYFDNLQIWNISGRPWSPSEGTSTARATPMPQLTGTALLSPAEQARAFAQPILAFVADRPPDFEDDFSQSSSGWPIGSSDEGEWGYQDGTYFISSTQLPRQHCCDAWPEPVPQFSDFVLEVDVGEVSGEKGHWNVIFRDGRGHYGVEFYPDDGSFKMFKWLPSIHTNLVDDVYVSNFNRETNHLQIIAQGPQIAVYLNEEPLWFLYDESLNTGKIMLRTKTLTNTPFRAHFDNLKVWDISDLPSR